MDLGSKAWPAQKADNLITILDISHSRRPHGLLQGGLYFFAQINQVLRLLMHHIKFVFGMKFRHVTREFTVYFIHLMFSKYRRIAVLNEIPSFSLLKGHDAAQ
jgi:hypothetical protein